MDIGPRLNLRRRSYDVSAESKNILKEMDVAES